MIKKLKCRFFGHQLQYLHPLNKYVDGDPRTRHEVFLFECARCGKVEEFRFDE